MTEAQRYRDLIKAIEDYTREHSKTPELARAALIKSGIYTRTGRLKKKYDESLDLKEAAA
jgi:hypothetical protein